MTAATGPDAAGPQKLLLATRNQHKVTEMRRILAEHHLDVEVLDASAFPEIPDVVETGVTFAENALLKARALAATTGLVSVADDSGLCVDVLGGAPGVFSARWSGRHGDDRANLELLLAQLGDVPDEHRAAHFTCAVALVLPDGSEHVVHGEMHGVLIREPLGENGFGYDPIFRPDGEQLTSAQLDAAAKDAISHRGAALRALAEILPGVLASAGATVAAEPSAAQPSI